MAIVTELANLKIAQRDSTLAYGHFTTIHTGHIRYLRHAKELGSSLAIALIGDVRNHDGKLRYPFSQLERAEALELLGIADQIILLQQEELDKAVSVLEPKVLVLGTEYENDSSLGKSLNVIESYGGSVAFHAGESSYATADLLLSSERDLRLSRSLELGRACSRQGVSLDILRSAMKSWKKRRLTVIGDTIVDQFAACEALGMSAEAPVVVVRELANKNYLGAAGVVAAHIRKLGAQCDFISVVGNDRNADYVNSQLEDLGISNLVVVDDSRPTTFKKRYVVENQKLFRVSRLEQNNVPRAIEEKIINNIHKSASTSDGIVVSDFVYGVITPRVLDAIKRLSDEFRIPVFGDIQCSTQYGSIMKFTGFEFLSPNERELRIALNDKDTGLEALSRRLLKEMNCSQLIVKLGAQGFIAYERTDENSYNSQAFPALSVNPLDVSGAGDSMLAVFSICRATGLGLMPAAALACCMSSLAVETMGNTPISLDQLEQCVVETFSTFNG